MTVHSCAFKYPDMRTTIFNKDLEMEMKMFVEEVAHLEREIIDLKNDIYIKEKELFISKMELQELNAVKKQQSENAVRILDGV